MLTVGSLYSGIGGIEEGLERAGEFKTVWQVEKDPFARFVLTKHWPNVRRWSDVKTFPPGEVLLPGGKPSGRAADDWRCDLVCGGFPCQDISKAGNVQGKRLGLDGARSGLWSEFLRVVRTLRPRLVLVENVAKLLVRGLGRILGDLAEVGYDAEWHCLPAACFGAPHIRDRVFVLAYPQCERLRLPGRAPVIGAPAPVQGAAREWSRLWTHPRSVGPIAGVSGYRGDDEWGSEPAVGRVAHGVPDGVDRNRCLGNAVVPAVAMWIGERIIEWLKENG